MPGLSGGSSSYLPPGGTHEASYPSLNRQKTSSGHSKGSFTPIALLPGFPAADACS